jgi:hypothetical protein
METVRTFKNVTYLGRLKSIKNCTVKVEINLTYETEREKKNYDDLSAVKGYYFFAVSAEVKKGKKWISGGQCLDHLKSNNPEFKKIKKMWEEYHLNDMLPGTKKQHEVLGGFRVGYDEALTQLAKVNMVNDRGYEYGHAWLLQIIPDKILQEIFENYFPDTPRGI